MTKYALNIVFYMKTYAQLQTNDDNPFKFELNNLNFKLTKIEHSQDSYSVIIKPINDLKQAEEILKTVKFALMLFVLEYNWSAIEIDEDIKIAHVLEKPRHIDSELIVSGDYDICQTTLIPLIPYIVETKSPSFEMVNKLKKNRFVEKIDLAFSKDFDKIITNEKLLLALEMYSKLSQFSPKTQFLELVTIIEILKPKYEVSLKIKDNIKLMKKEMKKIRDTYEKDSEEYLEFNRYFTDMGFWEAKSINKSLQLFVNEYQKDFKEYTNIDFKIKTVYSIRSDIVHNGVIHEDFDEYYDFLKDFVGKLLKIIIDTN